MGTLSTISSYNINFCSLPNCGLIKERELQISLNIFMLYKIHYHFHCDTKNITPSIIIKENNKLSFVNEKLILKYGLIY